MKLTKSILIITTIIVYAIISVFFITPWSKDHTLINSLSESVNGIIVYQIITLAVTLFFLIFLYVTRKTEFKTYLQWGNFHNEVLPEKTIGLKTKNTENWKNIGTNFAIIITIVTIVVMYFAVKEKVFNFDNFTSLIPFILIFSLSNAFVEEIMYRFGVVVALKDIVSNKEIVLISGLIFGSIHYFGTPGGIIGIFFAGFLGWFLAKSIIETKGIFWAYFIHFLQDFVIFSTLLLFI